MAVELTPEQRKIFRKENARRELARRHYADYLPYVHGKGWKRTRFSNYLATEVQNFLEDDTGHAYDILLIESPPQHGKSRTITESLPSWYLGKYPDANVILASYNDDFAERFCRRNKEKIKQFGESLFRIKIGNIDRATEFELTNRRGRLISRGIRSGITGNPGNLIIIDDPVKNREEADSETFRGKVWEEWQNSIKSRLSAGAKVIIIMTPWHEDDLAARVILNEPNLRILRFPVEAVENDPLGRNPGDSLCPELGKDNHWLADFKQAYINDPSGGARAWAALYMCNPRVEGGNIIHRDWWRYYKTEDYDKFGETYISVDAAFKGKSTSDYVAIEVWSKRGTDYFCRYVMNRQMGFTETLQAIRLVKRLFPETRAVLIEDKANGSAIIEVLQREMFCIGINPKGGKESRVHAISAAVEAGHVLLPISAPWLNDFIDQFSAFPAGAHDDMVDSASQALIYMIYSSGRYLPDVIPEDELLIEQEEQAVLDNVQMYDIYGEHSGIAALMGGST